ncbi:MAG: hypothetical protein WDN69_15795 [Aliidongia sp.]
MTRTARWSPRSTRNSVFSEKNQTVVLIVIGWHDSDIAPKGSPVEGTE